MILEERRIAAAILARGDTLVAKDMLKLALWNYRARYGSTTDWLAAKELRADLRRLLKEEGF
ncbi:MAG: hypothetical protein KAJ19_10075 [Gammaproteobacteria bacterium]|nr:hypothetical protein [Gammaproteobacteria bacterium]